MAKIGRRPVLDAFKRREIVAILSAGLSRRAAAKYVGCATSTIQNTAQRDPVFAEQLSHAESQTELLCLKNIQKAAGKEQYWRAAAWVLERKNPAEFGRRSPNTMTLGQVVELLDEVARILVEEVPGAKQRGAILKRLDAMLGPLRRAPAEEAAPHDA